MVPTILAVDDNRIALISRRFLLESAGYKVVVAEDAAEAVDIVRQQPIDLVLMDYYLPSGNGSEARREMKRIQPGMPILVLSGATEVPADLANVDAFLSKLDGPEYLIETLRKFLPPDNSSRAA